MFDTTPKYKIGDLVVIKSLAFVMDNHKIQVGDVGIIVSIDDECELISYWGIDYMVLINGEKIVFFEDELDLIKN